MYNVYINHFKRGNSVIDSEELMLTVPSTDGFPIDKPVVKANEDSAENFSFTMESTSPYYDAMLPLKTMLRVVYDGDIIFFGRVLTISKSSVFQTKNVTCEGKYAFLNDTYYEGKQEKYRSKITISQYLDRIISNHNTMAPDKPFTRGTVGVTLPSTQDTYEPTSWTQSSSLISNLTSNYGGHIKIRYTAGSTTYIDWYKYYARDLGNGLRPKVTVGKNVLDISSDDNIDNIFTRVIPIGDTDSNGKTIYLDGYKYTDKNGTRHTYSGKSMQVSFIRNLYEDSQLTDEFHDFKDYRDAESNYGIIYKTMSFNDADTQAKLFDNVKKWIKESYFGLVTTFTVKAVDMHIQDTALPKILLGDCVDVTYLIVINGIATWVTKKLVCKSVSYDLFNPDANSYTFGLPSDLLEHNKSNKKKSAKQASSVAATPRAIPKGDEDKDLDFHKISQIVGNANHAEYGGLAAYDSFVVNGELFGSKRVYDPNEVIDSDGNTIGNNYKVHKDKWFTARIVGRITLSGKTVKYVAFSGTRGLFAYVDTGDPSAITFWYFNKKGYTYNGSDSGMSTFEDIAKMIEKDTNATYGGTTHANQFRNNKQLKGSVKAYDPDKTNAPASHPEEVFQAQIVGKFDTGNNTKYVALSNEYGVFAYTKSSQPVQVKHWYQQVKGIAYDNISNLVETENGDTYSTVDGNPDSGKTVWLKTKVLNEQGSQGQILVGYDLTTQEDNWRIKLNVPIQYRNASGQIVVADGFVSASDFKIQNIDSFKTKLAIADVLIAGKLDAEEIEAELAYIHTINSTNVTADTYVSAYQINGTIGNFSSKVTSEHIIVETEGFGKTELGNCFYGGMFSENNGVIKLSLSRANGSTSWEDSFNMADTNFYKNAVSAAKETGANSVVIDVSKVSASSGARLTLNPGEWAKAGGHYYNAQGESVDITSNLYIKARELNLRTWDNVYAWGDSDRIVTAGAGYDGMDSVTIKSDPNCTSGNIKKGVSIYGVSGSYGGWVDNDIQLGGGGYFNTSSRPNITDGHTVVWDDDLGLFKNVVKAAINNGNWFGFKVSLSGSNLAKYYIMKFPKISDDNI